MLITCIDAPESTHFLSFFRSDSCPRIALVTVFVFEDCIIVVFVRPADFVHVCAVSVLPFVTHLHKEEPTVDANPK